MVGRQYKLGQAIGLALVAGAAASAQAAPVKSQGWVNASSTGIANANANSVLARGSVSSSNGQSAFSASFSNGNASNGNSNSNSNSNANANANANAASGSNAASVSATNAAAASSNGTAASGGVSAPAGTSSSNGNSAVALANAGNSSASSNGTASSSNGNSSSGSASSSSNASPNSAASNGEGNGNGNGNGASASANAGSGNSGSASPAATGGGSGGSTVVAAPADPAGAVTYGVDTLTAAAAANDFFGLVSGNDSKGINGLAQNWGGGWTLAAKDNTDSGDDVANLVDGVFFHVNAGAKAVKGSWTLTGTGDVLSAGPILMDMVAVLKSSTEYGLYYFENVAFDGSGGGDWLSPSFNAQGVRQELSHLSIYVRYGGMSMPGGGTSGGQGGSANPVSEPGSLALAGLGVAAMGWARRKSARRG